jgi:hypothetical protein
MITSLDYKSITLAAMEVRPVSVTGSVFSCLTATLQFFASFDGGPFIPLQGGLQIDNRPGLFNSVILQNRSLVPLTLTFYCGTCAVTYSPITVNVTTTEAATYAKGHGIIAIGAGASLIYNGVDGGNTRKQFILTNLDGAVMLYIQDANANLLLPVSAGESKTMAISGVCSVYNPNGGPVNCVVGEIFYA